MPFIAFFKPSSASLGRLSSSWVQEEPPSLRTEREGGQGFPWLFVRPSCILFVQTEGLFAKPPQVQAWVAGSRQGCRKSPLASAQSKKAVRGSLGFLYDPRASFSLRRRGCFAEPPRVRTGVARSRQDCRKSPLASARGKRSVGGSPGFFVGPSRFVYARKEGWNVPGYPRWARALALPVSCYRVSLSGGPCPVR